MARNERTSASVASKAARVLRDPNASPEAKSVAASALTQAPDATKVPAGRLRDEGLSTLKEAQMAKNETKPEEKPADDDKTKKVEESTETKDQSEVAKTDIEDVADTSKVERTVSEGEENADLAVDDAEAILHPEDKADPEEGVGFDNEGPAVEPPVTKLEEDGLHPSGDGTLRTGDGKVAWAPPGSHAAAVNGVQQDASGSFSSANLPQGARVTGE